MKYIKTYEEIEDYSEYLVIKPESKVDTRYYVVTYDKSTTNLIQNFNRIYFDKVYTLYPNKKIKRNKHQTYGIDVKNLDKCVIYHSNNKKDAYNVLASIYDSEKYNL